MNDIFSGQKELLLSIKKEINLLQQQVDYLIRNEQPLGLLDLDVLMNRTHTLYDKLCSVNLGSEELGVRSEQDEEMLPVGLDAIREMFGIDQNPDQEDEEDELEEEEEEEAKTPEEEKEEAISEENEDAYFIEELDDVQENEITPSITQQEFKEEPQEEPSEKSQEEPEEPKPMEQPLEPMEEPEEPQEPQEPQEEEPRREEADDMGFILNFEPVEEEALTNTAEEQNPSVFTSGDEIEMTIPRYEHDHIEQSDPPEQPDASMAVEPDEEIVYEPVVIGNMEELDDGGFEIEQPETVGERYQQEQEETLGERLQHGAVKDLQNAIGINDKFLFVNELFGGSMEKYNRSIANLNDLKTLNGALIYMNELRIELQWNSSNEAYKKLLDLVHRKFESQ